MFRRGPSKKRKRKKKVSKDNWFETCAVAELKLLCKASGVPVSGTKAALATRLLAADCAKDYGHTAPKFNMRSIMSGNFGHATGTTSPGGMDLAAVKERATAAGLSRSGKRFDIVLRLIQNATGKGGEPKKAAGAFASDGTFVPKKRAKSMKLPDPAKLRAQVQKKCFPPEKAQWKWSNYKSKHHLDRVINFTGKLLQTHVVEKKLLERGEGPLAWRVFLAVTDDWASSSDIRGMGYIEWMSGWGFPKAVGVLVDETAERYPVEERATRPDEYALIPWGEISASLLGLAKNADAHCQDGIAADARSWDAKLAGRAAQA